MNKYTKKELQYLRTIAKVLRNCPKGRILFERMLDAFMKNDKDDQYRSTRFELPGVGPTSSPAHLIALIGAMWTFSSPSILGKCVSLFGNFLIATMLTVFVLVLTAAAGIINAGPHLIYVSMIIGVVANLVYLMRKHQHNQTILTIVGSYGNMIKDLLESFAAADISVSVKPGTQWLFNVSNHSEVQRKAREYLESWALWIVFNERVDSYSKETGDSKVRFRFYYDALDRVGLVQGDFRSIYDRVKHVFDTEYAGSENVTLGNLKKPLPKPKERSLAV